MPFALADECSAFLESIESSSAKNSSAGDAFVRLVQYAVDRGYGSDVFSHVLEAKTASNPFARSRHLVLQQLAAAYTRLDQKALEQRWSELQEKIREIKSQQGAKNADREDKKKQEQYVFNPQLFYKSADGENVSFWVKTSQSSYFVQETATGLQFFELTRSQLVKVGFIRAVQGAKFSAYAVGDEIFVSIGTTSLLSLYVLAKKDAVLTSHLIGTETYKRDIETITGFLWHERNGELNLFVKLKGKIKAYLLEDRKLTLLDEVSESALGSDAVLTLVAVDSKIHIGTSNESEASLIEFEGRSFGAVTKTKYAYYYSRGPSGVWTVINGKAVFIGFAGDDLISLEFDGAELTEKSRLDLRQATTEISSVHANGQNFLAVAQTWFGQDIKDGLSLAKIDEAGLTRIGGYSLKSAASHFKPAWLTLEGRTFLAAGSDAYTMHIFELIGGRLEEVFVFDAQSSVRTNEGESTWMVDTHENVYLNFSSESSTFILKVFSLAQNEKGGQ